MGQFGWGELDVKDAMKMGDVDAAVLHWCQNACKSSWLEVLILCSILLNTVLVRTKALSFSCASTIFLPKTVPV
eukprot:SAG22_NODE_9173_length_605_cov_1.282609_1_plen_73_part_10